MIPHSMFLVNHTNFHVIDTQVLTKKRALNQVQAAYLRVTSGNMLLGSE